MDGGHCKKAESMTSDPKKPETHWIIKYIIVAETTVLLSGVTFFLTGYQNLVTHDDLATKIVYPWVKDKPRVWENMKNTRDTLTSVNESLHKLNSRLDNLNYEHVLRIQRLEDDMEDMESIHGNVKNGHNMAKKGILGP